MPNGNEAKTAVDDFFKITNDAMKDSMSLVSKSPQQLTDAWLRVSTEFLRFASQRFAAQAELLATLRSCKDVDEVVATETRFFENAADEYSQEFDRLAEVSREGAGAPTPIRKKATGKAA